MDTSVSGALAVQLHRHCPTHWAATYYPLVHTPAGRWADVTWTLHHLLVPLPQDPSQPTQWLEARSADPDHPCYAGHRHWAGELATGYTTALTAYAAEAAAAAEPLWLQQLQQRRAGTIVIPAGQLAEWVLDDLQDETTHLPR